MTGICLLLSAGLSIPATAQGGDATPIDEIVLYGVDRVEQQLLRYQFGDSSCEWLGRLRLTDGTPVNGIECLAFIPGRPFLYGVWNYHDDSQSKLVKIDLFSGEVSPFPSDLGFGGVRSLTVIMESDAGEGGGNGDPNGPESAILADSKGVDAYEISFLGVDYNADGTSSWNYRVRELPTGKDLSHWNLALADEHQVMAGTTSGYDRGRDGSTGFIGIKWDVADGFSDEVFTIVLDRHYESTTIDVLAKGGNRHDTDVIAGPGIGIREPAGNGEPALRLFATSSHDNGQTDLVTIDPDTGEGVGKMSLSRAYDGLAAGPSGQLYAVTHDELWLVDPASGSESLVAEQDYTGLCALECAFGADGGAIEIPGYDPSYGANGALFGFSANQHELLLFDPHSGTGLTYSVPLSAHETTGLVFVHYGRDVRWTTAQASYD
ncbi:MAG: hypothetical protein ACF8PN_17020 [Phycisphaerales bacterium]